MKPIAILLAVSTLTACSYVTGVPVEPGEKVRGIPFYGEKPILLVSASGTTIEYIPNPSKEYALQFGAFLAKNKSKFTRNSNGTLGNIELDLDSSEAVEPLTKLATAALDKIKTASGELSVDVSNKDVLIYDLIFDDEGNIIELRALRGSSFKSTRKTKDSKSGILNDDDRE